jgi:ABC-2 type transport system permease protein
MRNFWLIIQREYMERVRTKAFILSTILMPVFMIGVVVLPTLVVMHKPASVTRFLLVTQDTALGDAIQQRIEACAKGSNCGVPLGSVAISRSSDVSDSHRAALDQQIQSGSLDGALWLGAGDVAARKASVLVKNSNDFAIIAAVQKAVNASIVRASLATHGVHGDEADAILQSVDIATVNVGKNGKESASNPALAFMLPFSLIMILYMTVIIYGAAVMRSVIEEKSSRVMEVLLSSLRPSELMGGKLIGVGAVGLTQMLIWAVIPAVASAFGLAAAQPYLKNVALPLGTLALFIVFFLLGYLIYSAIFAAVGAMCNTTEEAQQFTFPVLLPLILCTVFAFNIMQHPDSQLALWLSLFPLTSPIIMFIRVVVQTPPLWQVALALLLLAATVWGLVLLCGRIYRVGILMYGKRPTLPEIVRWIRQS